MIINKSTKERVNSIMNEAINKVKEELARPVSITYNIKFNDISAEHIIQTVCKVCNTTWSKMMSDTRKMEALVPRHITIWLLYKYTGMSHAQVARYINRVDHTNSVHAVESVDRMIETNDPLYVTPLMTIEKCLLKLTEPAA